MNNRHRRFLCHGSTKPEIPTSTLWCTNRKGLPQPLSSDPKIVLECHGLPYIKIVPSRKESSQFGVSCSHTQIRVRSLGTRERERERKHTQVQNTATQRKRGYHKSANTSFTRNGSKQRSDLTRITKMRCGYMS
jgi:hypothetical protein